MSVLIQDTQVNGGSSWACMSRLFEVVRAGEEYATGYDRSQVRDGARKGSSPGTVADAKRLAGEYRTRMPRKSFAAS